MKLKLKKNQSFYDYLLSVISDTCDDLINKEFKEIFDKIDVKPELICRNSFIACYDMFSDIPRGHFSKSIIRNKFLDNTNYIIIYPMVSTFDGHVTNDDTIKIDQLHVVINEDVFRRVILDSFNSGIDILIDWIKMSVRHEIGHLIDYISFEGMNINDYTMMSTRRDEEMDAHNKKWDKYIREDEYHNKEEERLMEYYTLEKEAVANTCVGLTASDLVGIDRKLSGVFCPYQITLNVEVDRKEFPNEE